MSRSKISKQPSQYPPLPFHLLRLGHCISAIISSSILCFFTNHLLTENYSIPWTFILVLSISLFSLLILLLTTLLPFTFTSAPHLRPRTLLILNALLTCLWLLGIAFITWNLSWTLGHRCARSIWHNTTGIMVCRLYKALTAFVVTATACSASSMVLDVKVHREVVRRGKYGVMLTDVKQKPGEVDPWDASTTEHIDMDKKNDVPAAGNGFEPTRSGGSGSAGFGADISRPYHVQKPIESADFAYAAPSEQTRYDGGSSSNGTHYF